MALRDYILAGDKTRYDLLPQGVVMIGVTHSNLTMAMPDIRLDLHTTVSRSYDLGETLGTYHRSCSTFRRIWMIEVRADNTIAKGWMLMLLAAA